MPNDGRLLRGMLLGLLRPHYPALLLVLAMMTAQSVALLAQPWLAGELSTRLLHGGATSRMLWALFGLIVAQSLLGYAMGIRSQAVSGRLVADASARVYAHLQSLPLAWHNERQRGDVLALLLGDVPRLAGYVTGTLLSLLPLLLTLFGALFIMLKMAPTIAVAVAILMPALFILLRIVGRRLRPLGDAAMRAWAGQSAQAEQGLAMLPVIKSFAADNREAGRYREYAESVHRIEMQQAKLSGAISPVVRVLSAGVVLLLLGLAGERITQGELSTAQLVSLFLYGMVLVGPVSQLARVYGDTRAAQGTLQRLYEALSARPEADEGSVGSIPRDGDIEYAAVDFGYPGREPLFRSFNLRIRAGETVALTGINGAGKSTLVHLLLRLLEPQHGKIAIGGIDLCDFRLGVLREQIGLVAQQVMLFNASVADNIAYGRADADRDGVERAARSARAHDFIMQLPQGYDTVVGDQGVKLSGGQRQRIALARALLKEPPILILDEATAMFDPCGEQEFIAECHETLKRRTVILITHRTASLALADRILRIEDGKAVECTPTVPLRL